MQVLLSVLAWIASMYDLKEEIGTSFSNSALRVTTSEPTVLCSLLIASRDRISCFNLIVNLKKDYSLFIVSIRSESSSIVTYRSYMAFDSFKTVEGSTIVANSEAHDDSKFSAYLDLLPIQYPY